MLTAYIALYILCSRSTYRCVRTCMYVEKDKRRATNFLPLFHYTQYLGSWGGGVHDTASVGSSVDDHTHCTA